MTPRSLGKRSPQLLAALQAATEPRDVVIGLPDSVDGPSKFTVVADGPAGDLQAWDVSFDWDGEASFAPFWIDISEYEDLSPGSSSPIHGWVSWNPDSSIAIAFAHPELGVHGVAWSDHVAMIDPTTFETTSAPLAWAVLGRSVVERVNAALMGETDRARMLGAETGSA